MSATSTWRTSTFTDQLMELELKLGRYVRVCQYIHLSALEEMRTEVKFTKLTGGKRPS